MAFGPRGFEVEAYGLGASGYSSSNALNPRPQTLHPTHGLLSSSVLGLPYRTLKQNRKKELLRSVWVGSKKLSPERPSL